MSVKAARDGFAFGGAAATTTIERSLPFAPKFLYIRWSGLSSRANLSQGDGNFGHGVGTGTGQRQFICGRIGDNLGTTEAARAFRDDGIVGTITSGAAQDGRIDISAMTGPLGGDGYTLIIDSQNSGGDLWLEVLALGGDSVGSIAMGEFPDNDVSGLHNVTGLGFDDTVLVGWFSVGDNNSPPDSAADFRACWIGWSAFDPDQGFITFADENGAGTSTDLGAGLHGPECHMRLNVSGSENARWSITQAITDGFEVDVIEEDDDLAIWVAFSEGSGLEASVDQIATETDTVTDIDVTGLPFEPSCALVYGTGAPEDAQDANHNQGRVTGGVCIDETDRDVVAFLSRDNVATSEFWRCQRVDAVYSRITAAGAQSGLMDVISRNSDGWTFRMDTADNADNFAFVVSIGPAPNPPAAPTGLSATATDVDEITLAWTPPGGVVTGYKIERESPIGGGFSEIDDIAPASGYVDSPLSSGTEYNYRVLAYNGDGDGPYSNEDDALTIPAAPTVLGATPINPTRIDLAWTPPAGTVTGYLIERESPTGGGFAQINDIAPASSYQDLTASDGTEYNYRIRAYNGTGNGAYSNEDDAITDLIAPTTLTATAVGPNTINVVWNDLTTNETGYQVERESPIGGGFALVHTTLADVINWADLTVLPSTQYNYRVRAVNAIAQSAYSPEDSATTPAPPSAGGKIVDPTQLGKINRIRG